MTRTSQKRSLEPPVENYYNADGSFDFRAQTGEAPWWFDEVGDSATNVRNFFYNTKGIRGQVRGYKKARLNNVVKVPNPKGNLFKRMAIYNKRRGAYRKRAPARYPARKRTAYRKRTTYRKRKTTKTAGFSTNGFKLMDKQSYVLDPNNSVVKANCRNGSAFSFDLLRETTDTASSADAWSYPYYRPSTSGNYYHQFAYSRLITSGGNFISREGIAEHFNKFKVNKITVTFRFPDQAASTTNDKWPTRLWVNKRATNEVAFGNTDASPNTVNVIANELCQEKGWVKHDIKRKTSVSISWIPKLLNSQDLQDEDADAIDVLVPTKNKYLNVGGGGLSTMLLGPAIMFEFPNAYTNAANNTAVAANMWTTSVAGTYLMYTSIDTMANITLKGPNSETIQETLKYD